MVFLVSQSLGRTDNDAVAGMHADRVEVFHIADGDRGIVRVTDDLILDLFVAFDALFD